MPVIIPQIKAALSDTKEAVIEKALKASGINVSDTARCDIYNTTRAARNRGKIFYVHTVIVDFKDKQREKPYAELFGLTYSSDSSFSVTKGTERRNGRPVVVGFGPAGMFCALLLAENGYKPIVLERGDNVDERVKKVQTFWQGGELDESSNVQFGEGGAGTFSDGKLMTRIKDPLCRYVIEQFVKFGAPEEILTKAKPHIGTDKLRNVVRAIRERIIECGGEVRFNTRFDDFSICSDAMINRVHAGSEQLEASAVVLAAGHSARDTFEMLLSKNIAIEAKPFAVGARIEHLQAYVNESLYGRHADNPFLPQGEYQLSHTLKDSQSVYTFCMCPGGQVVAAASEKGTVTVNGMSEFARNGKNANAALVVAVNKNDFGNGILDGMNFARQIEKNAFSQTGGYLAPATTVSGFLSGKPSLSSKICASYPIGVEKADFGKILPKRVIDMMKTGLSVFSRKMHCFGDGEALLTAPETRTSSPVRILRNGSFKSLTIPNLYPCGEGAGYAGGITSSAVDGIKVALQIMSELSPTE